MNDGAEIERGTDPLDSADDGEACPVTGVSFEATWTTQNNVSFQPDYTVCGGAPTFVWDFGDGETLASASQPVIHSYARAGEYVARLTVIDEGGDQASDTQAVVVNPPVTYAPYVRLHPKEKYFPGNASGFLSASSLVFEHGRECLPHVIAGIGFVHVGALASGSYHHQQNTAGTCRHDPSREFKTNEYTPPGDDTHATGPRQGFYLDGGGFREGSPDGADAALFAGDSSLSSGLYYQYVQHEYIAYWFFYPYNNWVLKVPKVICDSFEVLRSTGCLIQEVHEGDWEHIVVRLDGADNRATDFAYYQHYCPGKVVSRTFLEQKPGGVSPEGGLFAGTHPIVFSALGGHASYPDANGFLGDLKNVACRVNGLPNGPDRVGAGRSWITWTNAQRAIDQPWYYFGGGWGWGAATKKYEPFYGFAISYFGPPGPVKTDFRPSDVIPDGWRSHG